ncbi:ABC-2 family transporter protein [Photorhabdus australis]|uniref:ABC-2 family transporter protein n=1 Tax=Photorhabdus australis TaxID=286156 RepID=UPI001F161CAA|nr:ABC-2 family transporter protein [Photorhabdus australis]
MTTNIVFNINVDNFYLFLFGRGSFLLVKKVKSLKLEPHLTLPINTQFLYVTTNIAFEHCLLSFLSLVLFFTVHIYFGTNILLVFLHFIMALEGVLILTSITWIIRTTIFWTASLVSIKNSNPCFKVLYPSSFKLLLCWLHSLTPVTRVRSHIFNKVILVK